MNSIPSPELCANCPLAEAVPGEKRQLEQSEQFIAKGVITHRRKDGDSVSFDFENGRPVGPHVVEIGLVPEGGGDGMGFWVDSSIGLSGAAKAIENCKGPKNQRYGFLKLRQTKVCGAVLDFAEEV